MSEPHDIFELLRRKRDIIREAEALHEKTHRDADGIWHDADEARFEALCREAETLNQQIDALVDAQRPARARGAFTVGGPAPTSIAVLRGRLSQ